MRAQIELSQGQCENYLAHFPLRGRVASPCSRQGSCDGDYLIVPLWPWAKSLTTLSSGMDLCVGEESSEYLSEKPFTYALCRISEEVCAGLVVNRILRGFPVAFRLKIPPAGGIKFKLKKEIFLFMHTASLQRVRMYQVQIKVNRRGGLRHPASISELLVSRWIWKSEHDHNLYLPTPKGFWYSYQRASLCPCCSRCVQKPPLLSWLDRIHQSRGWVEGPTPRLIHSPGFLCFLLNSVSDGGLASFWYVRC